MALENENLETKFEQARGLFPMLSQYTYLNCAARPPLANPIRKRLDEYFDHMANNPIDNPDFLFEPIESCRRKLARLFGCSESEIALTQNTSYGLNIAARGLDLQPGESVAVPDIEFPANLYPFLKLKDKGVNVVFIKSHKGVINVSDIEEAIDSGVKLLSISWVQFFNGVRNNIAEIGKLCAQNDVFLSIDAIQGAGNIPIALADTSIGLFSAGAEKWLLCPCGIGFTYVSAKYDSRIKDHYAGWLGVDWSGNFSSLLVSPRKFRKGAARFEIGTYPYQEIMAFDAALDIMLSLGVENIYAHNAALLDKLIAYLESSSFYHVLSPLDTDSRSSILSFGCDNGEEVFRYLNENLIIASFREGGLRISPHFYNNLDDIDRLIEALQRFESERGK